jgi:hypothetical protein
VRDLARFLGAILLAVLLTANAATALELEEVQARLGDELELRIERRGARLAARDSRDGLQQPLLWQAASMYCVDHRPAAAECVVRSTRSGVGGSEIQISSLPASPSPESGN